MIEVIIATAIIFAFIVVCGYLHEKCAKRHRLSSQFPGPPVLPFFGNSLDFFYRDSKEIENLLFEWQKKYGKVYRAKIFDVNVFNVADPKIIELVLSNGMKNLTKDKIYNFLKPWLGDGLLISKGKKWHNRRKIMTPAFHFNILERFVEVFDRQSRILVGNLQKHTDGRVFDLHPYITLLTLDVICETAMGTKINAQTDSQNTYVKTVAELANILTLRLAKVWLRSDLLFSVLAYKQKKKLDETLKISHDFTTSIILKRRQELLEADKSHESENLKEYEDFNINNKKPALLDILLRSSIDGQPLSNQDIREEVDTFMFGGHDTTTAGITFTLFMISRHKEVQDKLFEEIRSIVGDDRNAPITYRQLQEMKYIELVIKESLRLHSPIPGVARALDEDLVLNDGKIIPKGSTFNIMFLIMFKDPDYFAEPERFNPERFRAGKANELINSYTFIPFSAGSRNCVGQKFAMLELKSTISKILRYYELLPMGEAPMTFYELVLRSKNGIQMGLRDRSYK